MKRVLSLILALAITITIVPPPRTFAAEANASVDASNFFTFTNESHGLSEDTNFNLAKHTLDTHVKGVGDPWAFVNLRTGTTYGTTETALSWKMSIDDRMPVYNPGGNTSGKTTAAIAFELVFDTAGTFNPVVTYVSAASSPKYDFYLVDKTKETKQWYATLKDNGTYQLNDTYFYSDCVNNLSSSDYIGTIDMYGDGSVDTATFPAREVKAQSYYLVIIPNGYNENMVRLEEGTSKFITANIKSFAMAERPVLTEEDTLEYKTQFNGVMNVAMLPSVSGSGQSVTTSSGLKLYCMRGSNMLHYLPFASWKATYNYKAVTDESGAKLYETDESGASTGIPLVEECEPYNTMLLTKTDPWLIEGGVFPACHSSSVSADQTTGTVQTNNFTSDTNRPRLTVRINVPHAGKYNIQLRHNNTKTSAIGAHVEVFFGKAPVKTITGELHNTYLATYQNLGWFKCSDTAQTEYTSFGTVDIPVAGEYIVSLYPNATESLAEGNGNPTTYNTGSYATKPYQVLSLAGIKLTPVADAELSAVQAEYDAIASENNASLDYEAEEGTPKNTTTINAFAAYIDGTTIETDIIDIESAVVGKETKVTAPDKSVDEYTFLYWAKAVNNEKMIMSREAEYKFVPSTAAVNLIAVYEKGTKSGTDKAEFYNANGELITTLTANGEAPELPAMAGFMPATHWALYGSDTKYYAGDDITLDGTMIFVANYDAKQTVEIKVNGGKVSDANPEYGEVVTATASERSGENVFNYWEKNGEVVSFDTEYSFKAWENAELTAVYKAYKPSLAKEFRKIILKPFTAFDSNSLMAEFLGLEDAVEKGIMFGGTSRAPMTTGGNQYTIINNSEYTDVTGYAILPDGTVITDK